MTPERLAHITILVESAGFYSEIEKELYAACRELMRERDVARDAQQHDAFCATQWQEGYANLRQENARLREALGEVVAEYDRWCLVDIHTIERVRKVLAGNVAPDP